MALIVPNMSYISSTEVEQALNSKKEEGLPLYVWVARMRPVLIEKLDMCAAIASEIREMQHSGMVLHVLSPSNILVDPQTPGQCRIVNPANGRSTGFESPMVIDPWTVRDILPYLAPERTGMMRPDGDSRSLFYSLGTIYYEMISGHPPFMGNDTLELVHGHMAQQPPCLTARVKNLPVMVSRIILKLLSKDPDDRYQGLKSLVADLKRCISEYEKHGDVAPFVPGVDDVPDSLRFPLKLYGRDHETDRLRSAYERVSQGGSECLLITGEPGVGKTSLVHAFGRQVLASGEYFAFGKCDPMGRRIPLSGLKVCLRDMVRQILMETPKRLEYWKARMVPALFFNGKIIADDIPDLEYITGKLPEVPALAPLESRNRLRDVYSTFIRILTDAHRPVVLFIDDLQWADSASLDFFGWFLEGKLPGHLLVIGAFRIEDSGDKRMASILNDRWGGTPLATLSLPPMDIDAVDGLIRDMLIKIKKRPMDLSSVIHAKTGGNPFLVKRLIQNMFEGKQLRFDDAAGEWVWDTVSECFHDPSDDRGVIVQQTLTNLPEKTLVLLFTGSCAGNSFSLDLLETISGDAEETIKENLKPALDHHLIVQAMTGNFEFTHDRIRLAVYSMIPPVQKKRLHLGIGRAAMNATGPGRSDERVFYAVNQMNLGSDLMTLDHEKNELARLNVVAAVRARTSAALDAACRYSRTALALLPAVPWDSSYPTVFQLYMTLAECEYLMGNTTEAERIFDTELVNARWRLDQARAINLRIILYTAGGRIEDAVKLGMAGLRLWGEHMPERPGKVRVVLEYAKTWAALGGRSMKRLSGLPELTDLEKQEVVNLYINTGAPAYYLGPAYFAMVVVKAVRFSLTHGMTAAFPMAMISFGLVTCFAFGLYKSGFMFAENGVKLLSSINDNTFKARAYFIFGFFIVGWKEHAAKSVLNMRLAKHYGMETGSLIYADHSINAVFMTQLIAGERIDDILPEFRDSQGLMKRLNDPFITGNYMDNLHMVRILKEGLDPVNRADEEKREAEIRDLNNPLALFMYLNIRLRCDYYFGHYERCLRTSDKIKTIGHIPVGTLYLVEYCFYDALTRSACADISSGSEKNGHIRQLKNIRSGMKTYARLCPQNFEHKFLLVAAEVERHRGKPEKAMVLYARAAASAETNGYIQNAGLAHKLAADCLLMRGLNNYARVHVEEAVLRMDRWGADAVVRHLQIKYADLRIKKENKESVTLTRLVNGASLEHSLRAMATEMNLKALLKKTLNIAMENAGASRGLYLSILPEGLFIESEGWAEKKPAACYIEDPVLVESRQDLLTQAVYYTRRTGRHVIVDDASKDGDYLSSAYVAETKLKSVLVLPVYHQSDMTGILYLENRMVVGVFTEQRLGTLRLIASQAAVSIENARLYQAVALKEDRLRALSAELVFTEERARRKIAVELHDSIGHALTTVRMTLALAEDSDLAENRAKALRTVFGILDRCSQDVQTLTFDLSPPVLYDFGLVAALEWLSNKTREQHGLDVEIRGNVQANLSESLNIMVFQIVRELVFNCVKHARASVAAVKVSEDDQKLAVTVMDNGRGFRWPMKDRPRKNRSFGLFSARERVRYMGGEFWVQSEPGKGSRITFSLPLDCDMKFTPGGIESKINGGAS